MKRFFIGSDVGKKEIHFSIYLEGKVIVYKAIPNKKNDLKRYIKGALSLIQSMCIKHEEFEVVVAMEHTGIYINKLIDVLVQMRVKASVINAAKIKKTTGLDRSKNDKIDSKIIAEYAWRFHDEIEIYVPMSPILTEIKTLSKERAKLVKTQTKLTQGREDQRAFLDKKTSQFMSHNIKSTLKMLKKAIKNIEGRIVELIKMDVKLEENYDILISVPGIGPAIAGALLSYTNNFTRFDNAKQLGCYCGVVPFERSSGIFKGKGRVSKKCNMVLKTLLTMGAWSICGSKNHFGAYYTRKLEENKKKSLAINNLRNKMLKTAFACIKNKTMYRYDYTYSKAA